MGVNFRQHTTFRAIGIYACAVVILLMSGHVTSEENHHGDDWCHDHYEVIDAFQEVVSYLNISTPYLTKDNLDDVIDMTFHRVRCDDEEYEFFNKSGLLCDTCLTSDNIYQVLGLEASATLDEEHFSKASSVIIVFSYQIHDKCSNPPDWDTVTYDDFVDELMAFHSHDTHDDHDDDNGDAHDHHDDDNGDAHDHHDDEDGDAHDHHDDEDGDAHDHHDDEDGDAHDHHDDGDAHDHHDDGDAHDHHDEHEDETAHVMHESFFTHHQLEYLLASINMTYRPGQYGIDNPDVSVVCSQPNQESFRSRDVIYNLPLEHKEEGVSEAEIAAMSANVLARILQGHCIQSDRTGLDGLPEEGDFMQEIFQLFGEHGACEIDEHGFEALLANLSIGTGHTEDPHDHSEHARRKRDVTSAETVRMRVKRDDDSHNDDVDNLATNDEIFLPDVTKTCFSAEEILETHFLDPHAVSITAADFLELCPTLLQQAVQGCRYTHHEEDDDIPTTAEKYGYATVAAFIVSACAALGLVLVKARHTRAYAYVMSVMLGLAFGSLTGDALLHLIPHALGLHAHGHDDHAHEEEEGIVIEPFVYKMLVACGSVWAFFILQMVLQSFSGGHGHSHNIETTVRKPRENSSNNVGLYKAKDQDGLGHDNQAYLEKPELTTTSSIDSTNSHLCRHSRSDSLRLSINEDVPTRITTPSSVAWMVTIGDGIHNFADGLAIGASFALDWRSGLSTSLAVFCHELPHEFGDASLLISCGWSAKKVALFQLASAATCFIGVYIGVSISEDSIAREWIFIITAGMFLYIAMSDVVPELLVMFRIDPSPWKIFFGSNGGILLGFGLMLIIAIFEEQIEIS